ncbi:hypothetical protein [Duganella phyllosphaerae]|nr:hypothetical protein [Duganella phyllosphaerae]
MMKLLYSRAPRVLMGALLLQLAVVVNHAAAAEQCAAAVVASVKTTVEVGEAGQPDGQDGVRIGDLVSATCKVWPHDRKVLLAALVFETEVEDGKHLVVATVDAATNRVLARYGNSVGEDAATAFGPNSIVIDSAPYQLAPAVRAFGIRFTSSARGASCPDGIWKDELTLFVPRGQFLLPVLQGVAMSRSEAREGCFGGSSPTLIYDEAKLAIAIDKAVSHGYADLLVNARIVRSEPGKDIVGKASAERAVLRFDGQQYRPIKQKPWWLLLHSLEE